MEKSGHIATKTVVFCLVTQFLDSKNIKQRETYPKVFLWHFLAELEPVILQKHGQRHKPLGHQEAPLGIIFKQGKCHQFCYKWSALI